MPVPGNAWGSALGSALDHGMGMKRALVLALFAIAACNKAEAPKQDAAKGGPPPIPPYQTRAQLPAGDGLAGGKDGEALFTNRCGACHLAAGMGTNLLTKQRIAAGQPPETGMLSNRTDLTADYVKTVVRQGRMAMPRLTHVDVTDAKLDSIADCLGKAKS
jgi:mono/diheme cytochrome c family protein